MSNITALVPFTNLVTTSTCRKETSFLTLEKGAFWGLYSVQGSFEPANTFLD